MPEDGLNDPLPFRSGRRYRLLIGPGLSLADIGRILATLRARHGLPGARLAARAFDYEQLTRLARSGVTLSDGERDVEDPANDPNEHIDPDILMLWGMENARVARTQSFFRISGDEDCPESGIFDDQTLAIYLRRRDDFESYLQTHSRGREDA